MKNKEIQNIFLLFLKTASFVTNSQGDATQFFLNLPFGETMLEQMDGSYNNPYKFNAKELDEDITMERDIIIQG